MREQYDKSMTWLGQLRRIERTEWIRNEMGVHCMISYGEFERGKGAFEMCFAPYRDEVRIGELHVTDLLPPPTSARDGMADALMRHQHRWGSRWTVGQLVEVQSTNEQEVGRHRPMYRRSCFDITARGTDGVARYRACLHAERGQWQLVSLDPEGSPHGPR